MEKFQAWLIASSEDFQLILYFGLLFALIVLEQLFHYRPIERQGRWFTNFALTAISVIAMFSMPVTFINAARYATQLQWGLMNHIQAHWTALLFLGLLIRSFISFFTHYLAHKIPLMWRVHRVHHLDTSLDVTTNVRFHPLEFIINSIIGVPIVILAGIPVWVLMLYELLGAAVTLISHANISLPLKMERLLRYIIVTPDLHRVHHSSHQPETDSNFGAVFPLWDMIFRTFRTETMVPATDMEIGLKEIRDGRTKNLLWLLLSPFKNLKK